MALLLDDHLERLRDASALGRVARGDLPEVRRVGEIVPLHRRLADFQISEPVKVVTDPERAEDVAEHPWCAPRLATHCFGDVEDLRRLLARRPWVNNQALPVRVAVVVFAAAPEQVHLAGELVRVIGLPKRFIKFFQLGRAVRVELPRHDCVACAGGPMFVFPDPPCPRGGDVLGDEISHDLRRPAERAPVHFRGTAEISEVPL